MNIHFLGASVNANGQRAIARAKSYKGPDKKESFGSYLIIYKSGTATIVPMESYSVSVALPNPVPYRGVSIGMVAGVTVSVAINVVSDVGGITTISYIGSDGVNYGVDSGSLTTIVVGYVGDGYGGPAGYDSEANHYRTGSGAIYNGISGGGGYAGPGALTLTLTSMSPFATAAGLAALARAKASPLNKPTLTYVMASDGTVLASEVQNTSSGHTYYVPDTTWNGDSYCNMYVDSTSGAFNHQLTFTVPEDCIYPVPATPPDVFKARRKAWFLKNSTEFIAALKGKFQPGAAGVTRAELQTGSIPASWDCQLKIDCRQSYKTYQPTTAPLTIFSATSAADVVVSDTSANLTAAGTKVTERTTTFSYTDADGKAWSVPIDGTLTQAVTQHTLNGSNIAVSHADTYLNWYTSTTAPANETLIQHQYIKDQTAYGLGLVWNGVIQSGYNATSMYGAIGNPLTYAGYVPVYPTYSNMLIGTAPDIFIQYHNTVLPTYVANTAQSSTVMNNSAMYGVKSVSLRLFGPVASDGTQLGAFADPTDADGCTSISCYGTLAMAFDWKTGAFTFSSWSSRQILDANGKPILDALGNPTYPITALPKGISYKNASGTLKFTGLTDPYGVAKPDEVAYNAVVSYNYVATAQWPDVAAATAADKAAATATLAYATIGTKPPTTPAIPFGDPVRAFVLSL